MQLPSLCFDDLDELGKRVCVDALARVVIEQFTHVLETPELFRGPVAAVGRLPDLPRLAPT